MANKKFWLGMLVMVLGFGILVIGCDNDTINEYEHLFINQSSYTIVVERVWAVGNTFSPNNFILTPGTRQIVMGVNRISSISWSWFLKETSDLTRVKTISYWEDRTDFFRNN